MVLSAVMLSDFPAEFGGSDLIRRLDPEKLTPAREFLYTHVSDVSISCTFCSQCPPFELLRSVENSDERKTELVLYVNEYTTTRIEDGSCEQRLLSVFSHKERSGHCTLGFR